MTLLKLTVLAFICKKRLEPALTAGDRRGVLNSLYKLLNGIAAILLFGIKRGSERNGIACVFREYRMLIVKLESFLETYTESLTVIKRAAEKKHLSGYALSLCQSRYCLINNRLINTRRNVFLARALIKQRLYIGLGKDAAA